MSSLLDRLKVKNIPEKNTEYKILIPRKKLNTHSNVLENLRNIPLLSITLSKCFTYYTVWTGFGSIFELQKLFLSTCMSFT